MMDQTDNDEASVPSIVCANDDDGNIEETSQEFGSDKKKHSYNKQYPAREIASRETKWVKRSKITFLTIIFIIAISIGITIYSYLRREERRSLEAKFETVANEIAQLANIRIASIFDSLAGVSATITSNARASKSTWPFVRVNDFQVTGMMSNEITGAAILDFVPLVKHKDRAAWEEFSVENQDFINEGYFYDDNAHPELYNYKNSAPNPHEQRNITPYISSFTGDPSPDADLYAPVWQRAPIDDYPVTNLNIEGVPDFQRFLAGLAFTEHPVLSAVSDASYLLWQYTNRFTPEQLAVPHSYMFQPIYDTFLKSREIVGILAGLSSWDNFFQNLLQDPKVGLYIVVTGTCNQTFTYELDGFETTFIGMGDHYDDGYSGMGRAYDFAPFAALDNIQEGSFCKYSITIYPSQEWGDSFFTKIPLLYAVAVVCCFIVTSLIFIAYDYLVQIRQRKVLETANKTNAIVSSLFPENVRDRLIKELDTEKSHKHINTSSSQTLNRTKAFLGQYSLSLSLPGAATVVAAPSKHDVTSSEAIFGSKPIADLFPNTTIMFADMEGFTAWASVREPTHVFSLLETIYHFFDDLALKMKVYKVETVGDCYVAAAGLPNAREDHAEVMARFASKCLIRMNQVVNNLETTLGPGTGDLGLRIGLHSGPVTAGVLRGDKGRFQLFGDTVNCASRIETTGTRDRIHVSRETADILISRGKGQWVKPRADKVMAKGLGMLQTYWLQIDVAPSQSSRESLTDDKSESSSEGAIVTASAWASHNIVAGKIQKGDRIERLVHWNVEVLTQLLKKILSRRGVRTVDLSKMKSVTYQNNFAATNPNATVLDEFKDIISMPKFDRQAIKHQVDPDKIVLDPEVVQQVTDFVKAIARMYTVTPFHNFEHASHVTMSVTKLLSRIVNPNEVSARNSRPDHKVAADLHDYTFGITSDPLTQFACVFSALIHDLDHPGVPNSILVSENHAVATKYKQKSVAEQNSVDKAWDLLMQPKYEAFRKCIYHDETEMKRFRQLVVNVVMATDIMDKNLGALRKTRWNKAFNTCGSNDDKRSSSSSLSSDFWSNCDFDDVDRKATIVIEHLIQASDVAHTMQHWHVYRKWNERLFHEMYVAYKQGRSDKDPSLFWYEGEIGFFDHYIIPLAKKLDTCGVFGVSSDEYLTYAEHNRHEWADKGRKLVKEYLESYNEKK